MKTNTIEKKIGFINQIADIWNSVKFNLSIKKIGMRNIKTGLAVALSVLISKMLGMEYPFFAAIAAIVSMQGSVAESFTQGKNRMIGTLIGAIIGLGGTLIAPNNIIMVFSGIIAVIFILNSINRKGSIVIGCIVFLAISVNLQDEIPLIYTIDRIIDTVIGISVATFINYFIVPPDLLEKANKQCEKIKLIIFKIVDKEISFTDEYNPDILLKNISSFEKTLNVCEIEPNLKESDKIQIENMKKILIYSSKIQLHMNVLHSLKDGKINEHNKEVLEHLVYFKEEKMENDVISNETKIDTVYNYHLSAIIVNLNKVNEISL